MNYKYFVKFDDNGEIAGLYKSKSECETCEEYIVKLIPITRSSTYDLEESGKRFTNSMEKLCRNANKFTTEFDKMIYGLRRRGFK